MSDKRTNAQRDFDMAKHGWAFCSPAMLEGRLFTLRKLAARLDLNDKRHETMRTIESIISEGRKS